MIKKQLTLEEILSKRKTIKAFLFDLDGTLADSEEGIIEIVYNLIKSKGYSVEKQEIRDLFGKPVEDVIKTLVPVKSTELIWQYVQEMRNIYAKKHLEITKTFDGAIEVLKSLNDKKFKLAIASTKFKKFVVEQAEHFGFTKYVNVIVSGYDVENHKPAPDILFKTAELLDVDPTECIYIGDSPSDVIAGKAAGMLTIAVLTGPQDLNEIEKTKPDFVLQDLNSLHLQ